jgi:NAD(P)-dependent dehydrogenase (short-subunit alcohol dehydrogenase family)
MAHKKVWFITGAGRGMGTDIAKVVLAAGNAVVATGRNPDAVSKAVGDAEDLLVVKLDVTSRANAQAAVRAAVDRFGRIDVLVNNAGNFYAGYFEELTPEQIERQLATSLIGPMNVTRAVLPVMRKQRSGHIVSISSTAGLVGFEFGAAYAASKFGLEGWMESLAAEVEPFGIHATVVNPGFFRTELLTQESTNYALASIEEYVERNAAQREFCTDVHRRHQSLVRLNTRFVQAGECCPRSPQPVSRTINPRQPGCIARFSLRQRRTKTRPPQQGTRLHSESAANRAPCAVRLIGAMGRVGLEPTSDGL